MLELIYPETSVRFTGPSGNAKSCEILPVVDGNCVVTSQATRSFCHEKGLLHPVVHLHLIDRFSRIYLQKRGAAKDLYPGRWDTAVGGHISFGEYAREALYREAAEELKLFDFNPIFLEGHLYTNYSEKELALIYAAVGHFQTSRHTDEVSDGRWWETDEICASLGKDVFTPQFEEEFLRIKDKLLALL